MLHIHLGSITEMGLNLDQMVELSTLPPLTLVSREGDMAFNGPVHVRIRATRSGETVYIDGHAWTGVRLTCSRCLDTFDQNIQTDFSATAMPKTSSPAVDAPDEVELTADDMNVIEYDGNSIDLHEEVAQQILMALPFNPLCHPSCKGLCSRCGADLNHTPCRCAAADEKSPFAVLKNLSLPIKKE